jgi:uncharacterized protein (TIGR02271 family)
MATTDRLPLDATSTRTEDGWLITLPVRAERIELTREAIETEEIAIRREVVRDTERVQAELLREELRVETTGNAEVARAP